MAVAFISLLAVHVLIVAFSHHTFLCDVIHNILTSVNEGHIDLKLFKTKVSTFEELNDVFSNLAIVPLGYYCIIDSKQLSEWDYTVLCGSNVFAESVPRCFLY